MDYVNLGASGLQVSRIWLGMMSYGTPEWRDWVLDERAAEPLVTRALNAGVTTFDTADMYSAGVSEEVTGRLLTKHARREDVVIATKVFHPMGEGPNLGGLSRKHIMDAVDASLARLGSDYIDLYQIHRFDPATPVEETMEALHDVVKAGKARYIGASSMYAWQFAKAQHAARLGGWTTFVSMQPHYNLLYREEEREMIPQCVDMGVGVVPWSPLARGMLAGTRQRDGQRSTTRARSDGFTDQLYTDADFDVVDACLEVAGRHGVPSAAVALAWFLHKPGVTAPIVGATKLDHLDDAISSLDVRLSEEDIATLEAPYRPHPVRGHS